MAGGCQASLLGKNAVIVKRIRIFWSRFPPPDDLDDHERDSTITKTFSFAARFILFDE
jgi:hypothetical protein